MYCMLEPCPENMLRYLRLECLSQLGEDFKKCDFTDRFAWQLPTEKGLLIAEAHIYEVILRRSSLSRYAVHGGVGVDSLQKEHFIPQVYAQALPNAHTAARVHLYQLSKRRADLSKMTQLICDEVAEARGVLFPHQ